jgi:hypothetical protein
VLAAYAELAETLPDDPWLLVGEPAALVRTSKVRAQHLLVPRHGLAVHINAFNFPAWGMLGKLAVAMLAGMPVLSKPATSTSALAHRIAELIVDSKRPPARRLPAAHGPGPGPPRSPRPAGRHRLHRRRRHGRPPADPPERARHGVRLNVEADSLNAVVLGPDLAEGRAVGPRAARRRHRADPKGRPEVHRHPPDPRPRGRPPDLRDALAERLADIAAKTGDPASKAVKMGPLSTAQQLADARAGIVRLQEHARIVRGDPHRPTSSTPPPARASSSSRSCSRRPAA